MAHYVKRRPFQRGERQRNEWLRAVDLDIAKFWPVHQRLRASFRSTAKKAIFVAAIIQPFFGWMPKVVDTDVAQKRPVHQRLTASRITPAKRVIDVRQIGQPSDAWVFSAAFNPALHANVYAQELAGFRVRDSAAINIRWINQPSDAWLNSTIDADVATLAPAFLRPWFSYRVGGDRRIDVRCINQPSSAQWINSVVNAILAANPSARSQLTSSFAVTAARKINVRSITQPDFGWLTEAIPEPPSASEVRRYSRRRWSSSWTPP